MSISTHLKDWEVVFVVDITKDFSPVTIPNEFWFRSSIRFACYIYFTTNVAILKSTLMSPYCRFICNVKRKLLELREALNVHQEYLQCTLSKTVCSSTFVIVSDIWNARQVYSPASVRFTRRINRPSASFLYSVSWAVRSIVDKVERITWD